MRLLRDEGEQPVQCLANHFAMQRPSISEYLKVLREVGLVSEQKQGRHRYYRLQRGPLQAIYHWFEGECKLSYSWAARGHHANYRH